jgi:hypothetical protein
MKKITFLSLVSLSLTVAATAAVQNSSQNDLGTYTLPEYRVSASRYTDAEKAIEANLAEMRSQVRTSQPIRTELNALGTVAKQAQPAPERRIATQRPIAAGRS